MFPLAKMMTISEPHDTTVYWPSDVAMLLEGCVTLKTLATLPSFNQTKPEKLWAENVCNQLLK